VPDALPASLSILGQDGNFQTLLKKGAQTPAQARAVFATQKAGQRELGLKLYEGEGSAAQAKLVGTVSVELPAGLPPNTWLAVFFTIQQDLSIAVNIKENLRRINIDAEIDREGATAEVFK
jgi:molecular chaperone DnaK (HSP70)